MTDATIEDEEPKKKRDWLPVLLPVFVSLLFNVIAAASFFGAMNSRVTNLEDRQKIIEASRVTMDDLKSREALRVIEKQELDIRLNRMDDKLDRLVEMELARKNGSR